MALAVIAIAMTAVIHNLSQSIDTTVALRDRTVALWIAQNRLASHLTTHAWPAADTTEGTTDMAGREWRWREEVKTTPDADIRRVEIEIRTAPNREAVARLIGFLPRVAAATP